MNDLNVARLGEDGRVVGEGPWRNRLASQHSPYLLEHADQPVDWLPWGDEAFELARRLDRPVFLSIGYSACHYCHVMARESFSDPVIAALLNEHFVAIKVDREEHPGVDAVYLQALTELNGEAGWPASLFLDPDRRAFQGGTYYPPHYRYGVPGFREVLEQVHQRWLQHREDTVGSAARLAEKLAPPVTSGQGVGAEVVAAGVADLLRAFDWDSGGWGDEARFPHAPRLDLLLEVGGEEGLRAALKALGGMDDGGIHDHLGGGFHRYSVDPDWAVPHFEKMLVDNALLARTYLLAWARTRDTRWLRVAGGTLEFMADELRRPDGRFRASLDADDPMGEGGFYTWTPEELQTTLGRSARAFGRAWSVREGGDLPGGRSVLRRVREDAPLSVFLTRLRRARGARPRPAGDDKAVVAWNALAVRAFALAARLLGEPRYRDLAVQGGDALLALPLGHLPRLFRDGAPDGALEDHAFTAAALLELYQATGQARWLLASSEVAQGILARFRDPDTGSLLHVARDGTALPVARVGWEDHAEPSGAAVTVEVLQALEALGDTAIPAGTADAILRTAPLDREPALAPSALRVRAHAERIPAVLVIDGAPDDEAVRAMVRAWHRAWLPCGVLALVDPDGPLPARFEDFAGKRSSHPRGWLCEGGACRPPVDDAEGLGRILTP